jgi:hypothetical protein
MKPRYFFVAVLVLGVWLQAANAQFYLNPNLGIRVSGLKGVFKLTTQGGGTQTGNVADAGKTGFTFGVGGGYQVFPKNFAGGYYKLDVAFEASYTSLGYLEAGYNSQFGAGKFSADGLSGGSTMIIGMDIMPIHRLTIPSFKLLSPYAGLGFSLNLMNTKDVTVGPPSPNGVLTGNGDFKLGLLVFYGCVLQATDMIAPYIQFKHMIPFGSDTQFTQSFQGTGGQAGGTQTYAVSIQDVPGFFSLTAGVRITFK